MLTFQHLLFGHFISTGSHATEYVFLDMSYSFHHLYRQQKLQFRPPIEELRAKYYRDMKKFMCIPLHFRGVGESGTPANTIFPRLIDRNASSFFTVYRKVEWSCCVTWYTCVHVHVLYVDEWRENGYEYMYNVALEWEWGFGIFWRVMYMYARMGILWFSVCLKNFIYTYM